MAKQKSRPARWSEAAGKARTALDAVRAQREEIEEKLNDAWREFQSSVAGIVGGADTKPLSDLSSALEDLRGVQEEYEEWRDGLPDNLRSSALADKLEEVCGIGLDPELDEEVKALMDDNDVSSHDPTWTLGETDLDEIESLLDEAEGADLPRGFGRD